MAAMAARLMLSGVGKSGSPAPKSTTSAPSRRSFSASAATFMVEETLIVEILSARACNVCIILFPSKLSLQSGLHRWWHQSRNISTERNHFLYQPRTDIRESLARHQKRRLQLR